MTEKITQSHDPMHGMTLEKIIHVLVQHYGWEDMGRRINIRCFNSDPSVKSSLKFLRHTPWARKKVEDLFLTTQGSVWSK
ncbi:MAG: VF530 family protein [Mariprofundaceae bacterium]|nr:VF530 family protein [Mariprofundaceae bacterium]